MSADPIKQIVQRLHRKILVSMRAVADDEDDALAAAATAKLADLYDAQVGWLDRRSVDDAIITSKTIALNEHVGPTPMRPAPRDPQEDR